MKAALLTTAGIDNLAVTDVDEPVPGPKQVKVKLNAASLNYRDLVTVNGGYGSKQKQGGLIPLSDGAGEVVEIGPGVTQYKVGDRVTPHFFPNWTDGAPSANSFALSLGGSVQGCAAEFGVFEEHALLPTPDCLTDAEAAATVCAGLTAWSAVVEQGNIRPGATVLTQGTGGVSVFAIQFARMMGAEVIATTSSNAKAEKLKELGAAHVINYREDENWGKTAKALTGGRGVDLVVEVGGAGTLGQSFRAIGGGATIAMIGVLAGQASEVNMGFLLLANNRLQGITVGSRAMHARMFRAMELNNIRPVIDRHFGLDDIRPAMAHMQGGLHFGKVCIDI